MNLRLKHVECHWLDSLKLLHGMNGGEITLQEQAKGHTLAHVHVPAHHQWALHIMYYEQNTRYKQSALIMFTLSINP